MSWSFPIDFLAPPLQQHQLKKLEGGISFASFTGNGKSQGKSQGDKQKRGRAFCCCWSV